MVLDVKVFALLIVITEKKDITLSKNIPIKENLKICLHIEWNNIGP